jgi:hypothetical protein
LRHHLVSSDLLDNQTWINGNCEEQLLPRHERVRRRHIDLPAAASSASAATRSGILSTCSLRPSQGLAPPSPGWQWLPLLRLGAAVSQSPPPARPHAQAPHSAPSPAPLQQRPLSVDGSRVHACDAPRASCFGLLHGPLLPP